jgi:hypothetical protein
MNRNGDRNGLDLRTASGQEVNEAMAHGVFDALKRHKEAGRSVVVWEDGRIVHVPPDEIVIPDNAEAVNGQSQSANDFA